MFIFFRHRNLNVNGILNILDENDQQGEISIESLDVHELTNQDSGDDDEDKTIEAENLSGNQLRAACRDREW